MISAMSSSRAGINNETRKLPMPVAFLRWLVLLVFVLIASTIIGFVLIEPEKQKRLHQQMRFNDLQALLNMPKVQTQQARKTDLPELQNEIKLVKFSNRNGTQHYSIRGAYVELYRWLQQLSDNQWFPEQADWQWQGDSIEVHLSLASGAHAITQMPTGVLNPFPALEEPEPKPLASCLELWPDNLKLSATMGEYLVLNDGNRQWQYQLGDIHSDSGLMFSSVNNGEVILSFGFANEQMPSLNTNSFSSKNVAYECFPGALRINETQAQKPRWLP